jgi:DNA polymerase III epsilon subunit-like protein
MSSADWKATTVYMIDFEGSPGSGVVEYGVVGLREGRVVMVETQLCRPTGAVSRRDRDVHGLSGRELSGLRPFSDHYERFVAFRREGVLAAHNRHAENTFIKSTWPLPPIVPDWREAGGEAQEWGPWIDTLSICRSVYPGLESYGLGDLVDRLQLQEQLEQLALGHCPGNRRKPHCALYDALASALLLLHLESTEALRDRMSLRWLLQMSDGQSAQQELF